MLVMTDSILLLPACQTEVRTQIKKKYVSERSLLWGIVHSLAH